MGALSSRGGVAPHDGAKGCELMTAQEQKFITAGTVHDRCGQVLTRMCKRASQEKLLSSDVKIKSVERAQSGGGIAQGPTVKFSIGATGGSKVEIEDTFEHDHGGWKLDSNGSTSTVGGSTGSQTKIRGLVNACL